MTPILDKKILAEFDNYGSKDKEILWVGKPESLKVLYLLRRMKLATSLISFSILILIITIWAPDNFNFKEIMSFNHPFSFILSLFLIGSIYHYAISPFVTYKYTFYAITPDSIIIKNGVFFSKVDTISLWKIEEIFEQKHAITNKFNVSSITIWDGTMIKKNSFRTEKYYHLVCISNAPEILELIEKLRNEIKDNTPEPFNYKSIPKDDNYSDYANVIE